MAKPVAIRSRKTRKPKAPKAEWRVLEEVDPLVADLVAKYHKHLERATIVVLGKPKAGKRQGKRLEATVRKPTAGVNALLADSRGVVDYLIEIGLDLWGELDARGKRRVVDRALAHFAGLNDKGAWEIVGPDVSEFTAILERHGPYNADLELFVATARQMDLPFAGEA